MSIKRPISKIFIIIGILVLVLIVKEAFNFYKFSKKQEALKDSEQQVKVSCLGEYKAVINLYEAWFYTIPVSLEGMIEKLESLDNYDSNFFDITRECFVSTPVEYETRMDGGGYRLIYTDAWGNEQIEIIDFDKEYR